MKNESYGWKKIEGPESIRKDKLYNFTDSDHRCEVDSPEIMIGKNKFSVALVMTVHSMDRANDKKDGELSTNVQEFSLGNIKFWLTARVFEHKLLEHCSESECEAFESYGLDISEVDGALLPIPIDTELECEALQYLDLYLKEFGRLSAEEKGANYRNKNIAETRWFAK